MASGIEADISYNKILKSTVIRELKEDGEQEWQSEWDASTKGTITKSFVSIIRDRPSKRLQMGIKQSIVTGHCTLRSYYYRFKIIDDLKCICNMGPQTLDHLLWECELLRKQREVLKNRIKKAGGNWPLMNSDLGNKHTKLFQRFVNSINFETL